MAERDLLRGKRILIVDDEPDVLETLEELLTMCDVVRASSFEEAKDLLETQYFDMAILDIMGVEGYDLLEIANQNNIPALMLTAHALSPDDLNRSVLAGAKAYIPKEKMADITIYLADFLKYQTGAEKPFRWFTRLKTFFNSKFGEDWLERYNELREKAGQLHDE